MFPHAMVRNPRYYCCLTIPGLLLLGNWLAARHWTWKWSITGLLTASSLACVVLDSSRFSMDHINQVSAFLERDRESRCWMAPKDGFCLFVRDGGVCRDSVGIHLLTTSRSSDNFQNLEMVCPQAEVAESASQIDDGYVVLTFETEKRESLLKEIGPRWSLVHTVEPGRNGIVEHGVRALESIGVPSKYTRRLLSNEGEQTEIWKVTE
jgi:hypothetical protein